VRTNNGGWVGLGYFAVANRWVGLVMDWVGLRNLDPWPSLDQGLHSGVLSLKLVRGRKVDIFNTKCDRNSNTNSNDSGLSKKFDKFHFVQTNHAIISAA